MNYKIKVKKIWSLNPTKYKLINLDEASGKYAEYISHCIENHLKEKDFIIKSFVDWLETEI